MTTSRALVAVLALALASLAAARPCSHARASVEGAYPAFCGKFQCPPFVVNADRPGFEVRTYAPGTYATTRVTGSGYSFAYTRAASRLYRYFNGGNYEGATLNQTTPLFALLLWSGDEGKAAAAVAAEGEASARDASPAADADGTALDYTFAYWIPSERQANPPMPADDAVKVVSVPESVLFVKVFGGYAPECQLRSQANLLNAALLADGSAAWDGGFAGLVYDGPAKLFGRHNEVVVFEKDPRSNCTDLVGAIAEAAAAAL